jgi:hypothetical protein
MAKARLRRRICNTSQPCAGEDIMNCSIAFNSGLAKTREAAHLVQISAPWIHFDWYLLHQQDIQFQLSEAIKSIFRWYHSSNALTPILELLRLWDCQPPALPGYSPSDISLPTLHFSILPLPMLWKYTLLMLFDKFVKVPKPKIYPFTKQLSTARCQWFGPRTRLRMPELTAFSALKSPLNEK